MIRIGLLDIGNEASRTFVAAHATDSDYQFTQRYKRYSRRFQSLAGRILLRMMITDVSGNIENTCRINSALQGETLAPIGCNGDSLHLTLSHSHLLVAGAISDLGPIGIDVEYHASKRPFHDIARFAFGRKEAEVVKENGAESFYRIWTLREGLTKALRKDFGFVVNQKDLFHIDQGTKVFKIATKNNEWFCCHQNVLNKYSLALVFPAFVNSESHDKVTAVQQLDLTMFPHEFPSAMAPIIAL